MPQKINREFSFPLNDTDYYLSVNQHCFSGSTSLEGA